MDWLRYLLNGLLLIAQLVSAFTSLRGRFNNLRWCFQRWIWVSTVWAEGYFNQPSPLPVFKRSGQNQYCLTPKKSEQKKKKLSYINAFSISIQSGVILTSYYTLKHMLSCTFAGMMWCSYYYLEIILAYWLWMHQKNSWPWRHGRK